MTPQEQPDTPTPQLYDTYFKTLVKVLGFGYWNDPSYIRGKFYRVQYPDGTVMDSHESAFTVPNTEQPTQEEIDNA